MVGDGIYVADDFCRHAAVVFEAGGSVGDIVFGFDDGLTGVAAFEFGQPGGTRASFLCQAEENASAFLGCRASPWAFFEGRSRRDDGAVDIFGAGVRYLGDYFFGRRIVDGESLRGWAGGPFAVDEYLVGLYFCCASAGHVIFSCVPQGLMARMLCCHSGTTEVALLRIGCDVFRRL